MSGYQNAPVTGGVGDATGNRSGIRVPQCSDCGRRFEPGTYWSGSNYCKASFLLRYIVANPGRSTWEISQAVGMAYGEVSRALLKAREYGALEWDAEAREGAEGFRFRYRVAPGWQQIIEDRLHCLSRREPAWTRS